MVHLQCVLTPADPYMPKTNEEIAAETDRQVRPVRFTLQCSWYLVLCAACCSRFERRPTARCASGSSCCSGELRVDIWSDGCIGVLPAAAGFVDKLDSFALAPVLMQSICIA